jgi:hypothetical protein
VTQRWGYAFLIAIVAADALVNLWIWRQSVRRERDFNEPCP